MTRDPVGEFPSPVRDLITELERHGFRPLPGARGDSAVNVLFAMTDGRVVVEFLADRGQWNLRAGQRGENFDTDVWAAYFTGSPVSGRSVPIEEQTAYIVEHLDELRRAVGRRGIRALTRLREERARKALAAVEFPPSFRGLPSSLRDD